MKEEGSHVYVNLEKLKQIESGGNLNVKLDMRHNS